MLQKTVYSDGHSRVCDLVTEQLSVLTTIYVHEAKQPKKDGLNPNQSPSDASLYLSSNPRNFASSPQRRAVLKMATQLAKLSGNSLQKPPLDSVLDKLYSSFNYHCISCDIPVWKSFPLSLSFTSSQPS